MGQLKLHDTKILISENSLHDLLVYVNSYDVNNIFILVDENTYKYCYPILLTKIPFLKKSSVIKMKSGESYKSMDVATNVFSILLARGINRASLIINLGGGVICDIGGFIASVIKRGVNFINLPTTLMAQVDASVGGKVGVNFESSKNQIGLFSNPEVIFIYTPFVKSLPKEYFISACAEILKYGLIFDAEFWNENIEGRKITKGAGEVVVDQQIKPGATHVINTSGDVTHKVQGSYEVDVRGGRLNLISLKNINLTSKTVSKQS